MNKNEQPTDEPNHRVCLVSPAEVVWSFEDARPRFDLKTSGHTATVYIDPFPCYTHGIELVAAEVKHAESLIKLPFPPHYFVLPFESLSRTNGYADGNSYSLQDDKENWYTEPRPYIMFSGKRICIAPSMTRYLVSHEFGHVVHSNLAHKLKLNYREFAQMYAKDVRHVEYSPDYGGLKWHTNTNEIIANDVRVGILDREIEFWPHEVARPSVEVIEWWKAKVKEHLS